MKMKAAMRLRSLINSYPHEIQWRTDLGQLYYDAGFLDAAGLFWMLDDPVIGHVKECVALYEESVNNSPQQILKDINFRGDTTALPVYAREKLEALEVRKRAIEDQTRENARKNNVIRHVPPESFKDRMIKNIGCLFVILLGILFSSIFIFGLKQVKRIITEW
ncbi:hypothetical protein OGH69_15965 [Flavobacterium sp. MFBS3-15]|nr:DUF6584 family protein [Flavobacterium sp. MFBS3-15]MCW4470468.1 hypothetical protein [Flavobacterium sp. MFBS3-15]